MSNAKFELRWRHNGIGPMGMVLEFRNSQDEDWQRVTAVWELTDSDVEYYRARDPGHNATIIR